MGGAGAGPQRVPDVRAAGHLPRAAAPGRPHVRRSGGGPVWRPHDGVEECRAEADRDRSGRQRQGA
eukprot:115064-Alexandrium_andersonii.AAC.1